MASYEVCPVYEIRGASLWNTLIYKTKEKALRKLDELMTGNNDRVFRIEYRPHGMIIEGFDEDTQEVRDGFQNRIEKGM